MVEEHRPHLDPTISLYGKKTFTKTLLELETAGLFDSTERAQLEFPSVFQDESGDSQNEATAIVTTPPGVPEQAAEMKPTGGEKPSEEPSKKPSEEPSKKPSEESSNKASEEPSKRKPSEDVAAKITQSRSERASKKASELAAKKASELATKKASELASKRTSELAAKKAAELAAKKAAEQVSKEASRLASIQAARALPAKPTTESIKNLANNAPSATGVKEITATPPGGAFSRPTEAARGSIPPLYPFFISAQAQHKILSQTQHLLEDCFFEFAKKWMPEVLDHQGWDSANAIELTTWEFMLSDKACRKLPLGAMSPYGPPFSAVYKHLRTLRNAGVHRISITAQDLSELLRNVSEVPHKLQDVERLRQLEAIRTVLDEKMMEMTIQKIKLQKAISAKKVEFDRARMQLEDQEQKLIDAMVKEDRKNKAVLSRQMEMELGWALFRAQRRRFNPWVY